MRIILVLACLAYVALSDMYLQSISGSNNRLDEANRDRANGNRCFDSQNNNRGGYNVGKYTFYEGETVTLSWTNQHSSGKYQMAHTEFVIQAMCETQVRDGTSTRTPPDAPSQCLNFDCDNDVRYCRHESYNWYQMCKSTRRNYGLFTANQNLAGGRVSTKNTRQNPAGTRRGYECPEERDYFPYWRPTPWFDIAYINADNARCQQVQDNSHNKKALGYCAYNSDYMRNVRYGRGSNGELPNNQAQCDSSTLSFQDSANNRVKRFNWVTVAAKNISAPACPGAVPTSRANHHGLIQNSNEMMTYQWTIPNTLDTSVPENDRNFVAGLLSNPMDMTKPDKNCVLRLRYNITTADYQAWAADNSIGAGLDYMNNTKRPNNRAPNADQDPALVEIWKTYGLTFNDVWCNWDRNPNSQQQKYCRGYIFRNNPRVDPFNLNLGGPNTNTTSVQLQLAINTNQFGRTFQDRTHAFLIVSRPANGFQGAKITADEPIYSIVCRGKRGNIVQVYPATEYFFHPEGGQMAGARYPVGAALHFQCAGSNTNPNNNDGQGKQGTDRSNYCPSANGVYGGSVADPGQYRAYCGGKGIACHGDYARNYPARLTNEPYASTLGWTGPMNNMYAHIRNVFDASKSGLPYEAWRQLCMQRQWINGAAAQDEGNMEELDDAAADWNMEPLKVGDALAANGGATEVRIATISTRNNNFSNRNQKTGFTISEQSSVTTAMVSSSGGTISAASGLGGFVVVPAGAALGAMPVTVSTNEKKCEMTVDFDTTLLAPNGWLQLLIPCEPQALHQAVVKRSDGSLVSDTPKKGFAGGKYMTVVSITTRGTYHVEFIPSPGAIAAVVIGCVCFACAFGGALAKKFMS